MKTKTEKDDLLDYLTDASNMPGGPAPHLCLLASKLGSSILISQFSKTLSPLCVVSLERHSASWIQEFPVAMSPLASGKNSTLNFCEPSLMLPRIPKWHLNFHTWFQFCVLFFKQKGKTTCVRLQFFFLSAGQCYLSPIKTHCGGYSPLMTLLSDCLFLGKHPDVTSRASKREKAVLAIFFSDHEGVTSPAHENSNRFSSGSRVSFIFGKQIWYRSKNSSEKQVLIIRSQSRNMVFFRIAKKIGTLPKLLNLCPEKKIFSLGHTTP